jgi:hypothetical protein
MLQVYYCFQSGYLPLDWGLNIDIYTINCFLLKLEIMMDIVPMSVNQAKLLSNLDFRVSASKVCLFVNSYTTEIRSLDSRYLLFLVKIANVCCGVSVRFILGKSKPSQRKISAEVHLMEI